MTPEPHEIDRMALSLAALAVEPDCGERVTTILRWAIVNRVHAEVLKSAAGWLAMIAEFDGGGECALKAVARIVEAANRIADQMEATA